MFWRERETDSTRFREQNGAPPCGQVRVLVVGDAGELSWFFYLLPEIIVGTRKGQNSGC